MSNKRYGTNPGSIKHILIDKSNARVVVTVSIAVFAVIFSLVASKTLWSQAAYQSRVISKKQDAKDQLKENLAAVKELKPSYVAFVGASTNAINGNALGVGPQDGNNAKIILDALPNRYDYPSLITNLETIAAGQGLSLGSIVGVDDAIAQSGNTQNSNPVAVEMPFQISVIGDYAKTQAFIASLERSIRPIRIRTVDITGAQDKLTTNVTAVTYYQPSKSLNTRTEVVK